MNELKKFDIGPDTPQSYKERLDKEKQINEVVLRKTSLGRIDERVIYNKELLLEVSNGGYDPLDPEDVKNYLENKPPKNLERNLILCGAYENRSLGQSEYEEDELLKLRKTGVAGGLKKAEDIYLSDIPNRELLKENQEGLHTWGDDSQLSFINAKESENEFLSFEDDENFITEDKYRQHLAKVFGAEEVEESKEESTSREIIKKDSAIDKVLTLIKELRALGFTEEEIKKEIKRL